MSIPVHLRSPLLLGDQPSKQLTTVLLDLGTNENLIRYETWQRLRVTHLSSSHRRREPNPACELRTTHVRKSSLGAIGQEAFCVKVGEFGTEFSAAFVIVRGLTESCILGFNFLRDAGASMECSWYVPSKVCIQRQSVKLLDIGGKPEALHTPPDPPSDESDQDSLAGDSGSPTWSDHVMDCFD
jgi:hypothetical protein